MWRSSRLAIAILSALLGASLIAVAILYPLALRPLVRSGDTALVERARRDAALLGVSKELKTFPIVMRLGDRNCAELRSTLADGAGSYVACYDAHTGNKVEELSAIGF